MRISNITFILECIMDGPESTFSRVVKPAIRGHLWDKQKVALITQVTS